MCHPWCIEFVKNNLKYWPEKPRVLEVGSYNINGTVRDICEPLSGEYIGIDINSGPNVDVVLNAEDILSKYREESFDVIISTEMLEHARNWPMLLYNIVGALKPSGLFIMTSRSQGFFKHNPPDYWRFS